MSSKSKIILILIVVLLALGVIFFVWQNPLVNKPANLTTEKISSGNFEQAQKIEISIGDKNTVLEKQEDKWLVSSENNAEADSSLIDSLLNGLKDAPSGQIISQNENKLALFDLTDKTAVKLKISDSQNNVLLNILIGKNGPLYSQSYVKNIGSKNILLLNASLTDLLQPASWIKKEN